MAARIRERSSVTSVRRRRCRTHLVLSCDLVQFLLASTLVERLRVLRRAIVVIHAAFPHNVRHFLQQESIVALNLGVSVLLRQSSVKIKVYWELGVETLPRQFVHTGIYEVRVSRVLLVLSYLIDVARTASLEEPLSRHTVRILHCCPLSLQQFRKSTSSHRMGAFLRLTMICCFLAFVLAATFRMLEGA